MLIGARNTLEYTSSKAVNKINVHDTQYFIFYFLSKSDKDLQCCNIQFTQSNSQAPKLSLLIDGYASIFEIPTKLSP